MKMFSVLLPIIIAVAAAEDQYDYAARQLVNFKKKTKHPGLLTSNLGVPVDYKVATSTLNADLITHFQFMEMMTHFDHEIIPERTAHALGSGAFGYFKVTHDVSHICKSHFLGKIGRVTPVAARFSYTVSSKGSTEISPELKGFAVKFYTKEGIYDLAGVDSPMFPFRDPGLTASAVHSAKRNPTTNLIDLDMTYDFITHHPEELYRLMYTMSYGLPDGFEHMSGHGIHTFGLYNKNGTLSNCKIHWIPDAGRKFINSTEAARLSVVDRTYYTRKLYNSIESGNYPTWQMKLQCFSDEEVNNPNSHIWDSTCADPFYEDNLIPVGVLVLNRNPENYHREIEQLAFCPGNIVKGMIGSPDTMYRARTFAYRDTQHHRLGANFENIPVNCPLYNKVLTYNRDGAAPVGDNGGAMPWYYPNSFNGPKPYKEKNRPSLPKIHEEEYGEIPTNFQNANDFYEKILSPDQQNTLTDNLSQNLCTVSDFIRKKIIMYLKRINCSLGDVVAKKILSNC